MHSGFPCGIRAHGQHVIPRVLRVTALDDTSSRDNTRPPDAQGSPGLGVISSRALFGIGCGEGAWFIEQVGQAHEVCSRGECFGHALKLEVLGLKRK